MGSIVPFLSLFISKITQDFYDSYLKSKSNYIQISQITNSLQVDFQSVQNMTVLYNLELNLKKCKQRKRLEKKQRATTRNPSSKMDSYNTVDVCSRFLK